MCHACILLLDWHPKLLKLLKPRTCKHAHNPIVLTYKLHESTVQNLHKNKTWDQSNILRWMDALGVLKKFLKMPTKLRLQIHVFGNHLSNMKKLILFNIQSEFDSDNK